MYMEFLSDASVKLRKYHKIMLNLMGSHLVNDNFYAFSFNKTLLDMSMHELP